MQGDNLVSQQIRPLTKAKKTGELYSRPAPVEEQIADLSNLAESEFLTRLKIKDSESDKYLLDEVLVYFVREALHNSNREFMNQIFDEIYLRMTKITMGSWSNSLEPEDKEDIHHRVSEKFVKQICDIKTDIGDYAQVRFGDYVSKLAVADRKRRFKEKNKELQNIELDKPADDGHAFELETNELSIEKSMVLREGFESLPEFTQTAVYLICDGWAIESKDPNVPTICKRLKVTSRTIRNWIRDAQIQLSEYRGLGS